MYFKRVALNDKLQQNTGYIVSNCTGLNHHTGGHFTIQGAVYTTVFEEIEVELLTLLNENIGNFLDDFLNVQAYA